MIEICKSIEARWAKVNRDTGVYFRDYPYFGIWLGRYMILARLLHKLNHGICTLLHRYQVATSARSRVRLRRCEGWLNMHSDISGHEVFKMFPFFRWRVVSKSPPPPFPLHTGGTSHNKSSAKPTEASESRRCEEDLWTNENSDITEIIPRNRCELNNFRLISCSCNTSKMLRTRLGPPKLARGFASHSQVPLSRLESQTINLSNFPSKVQAFRDR